jgi:ribonucleoside-triphosphate reductase (formate)
MASDVKLIVKRDGGKEAFSFSKIQNALDKAFMASGLKFELEVSSIITNRVVDRIQTDTVSVEQVQDLVESETYYGWHSCH